MKSRRGYRWRWVKKIYDKLLEELEERADTLEGDPADYAETKEDLLRDRDVRKPLQMLIEMYIGGPNGHRGRRGPFATDAQVRELARRMMSLGECRITPPAFLDFLYEFFVPPIPAVDDSPRRRGTPQSEREREAERLRNQVERAIIDFIRRR